MLGLDMELLKIKLDAGSPDEAFGAIFSTCRLLFS